MNTESFFKPIRKVEKQYFNKVRKTLTYKLIKFIVLFPFYAIWVGSTKLISKIKIKRKNKPDIVLTNIVEGFKHLIYNDPDVEFLATERAKICAKCPFAEKSGIYSVVIDNKTKNIQGMKCGKCGCNLSAKVRSVQDACPLGKW
jgi:hypothetical protein